jgi:hypothetical protein
MAAPTYLTGAKGFKPAFRRGCDTPSVPPRGQARGCTTHSSDKTLPCASRAAKQPARPIHGGPASRAPSRGRARGIDGTAGRFARRRGGIAPHHPRPHERCHRGPGRQRDDPFRQRVSQVASRVRSRGADWAKRLRLHTSRRYGRRHRGSGPIGRRWSGTTATQGDPRPPW